MSNDRITVWAVVGSIIVGFFASLVATIGFAWLGRAVPAPIGHLLDVSFGSLATLLAQTRSGEREKGRVGEGEKGTPCGAVVSED